jgi:hypothetical protein
MPKTNEMLRVVVVGAMLVAPADFAAGAGGAGGGGGALTGVGPAGGNWDTEDAADSAHHYAAQWRGYATSTEQAPGGPGVTHGGTDESGW